jgi:exosortase
MNSQTIQISGNRYFLATVIVLILAYLPALYDMVLTWATDANYSHGFLLPIISGYLIWKKRHELATVEKSVNGSGIVLIIAGMILFILGNAGSEYFTVRFSLVLTLFGLVLYHFGGNIIKRTWFEIVFLLFMIPIPYVLYFSATFPMQLLASKVSVSLLSLLGVPVIRQGNIIHLAGQSLEVAEACSGLRSLISLLALGAIYAYLTQKRFSGKVILFLSTILIAVIGNTFRVFISAIIVYLFKIDINLEPVHTIMGLTVFVVAFIILFIFGAVVRKVLR